MYRKSYLSPVGKRAATSRVSMRADTESTWPFYPWNNVRVRCQSRQETNIRKKKAGICPLKQPNPKPSNFHVKSQATVQLHHDPSGHLLEAPENSNG